MDLHKTPDPNILMHCPKCGSEYAFFRTGDKVRFMCSEEAKHKGWFPLDDWPLGHETEGNHWAKFAASLIVGTMVLIVLAILARLFIAILFS